MTIGLGTLYCQEYKFIKKSNSISFAEVKSLHKNRYRGFNLGIGLNASSFLYPRFIEQKSLNKINGGYGLQVHLGYSTYSFFFDSYWFVNEYNVKEKIDPIFSVITNDKIETKHRGIEVSANIRLLPSNKSWTKRIYPYLGIGYSFSEVISFEYNDDKKEGEREVVSEWGTEAIIWNVGLNLYNKGKSYFKINYKQTLPFLDDFNATSFRSFSASFILILKK